MSCLTSSPWLKISIWISVQNKCQTHGQTQPSVCFNPVGTSLFGWHILVHLSSAVVCTGTQQTKQRDSASQHPSLRTQTGKKKKKKRLVQRAGGLKKDGRLRSVCEGRPAFPPRHRLCIQTTFQLHAPAEMQSHGGGDARQKAAELKRQLKQNMFFLKVRFLHCRGESWARDFQGNWSLFANFHFYLLLVVNFMQH